MQDIVVKSVLEPNNIRYCNAEGFYESGLLVHNFGVYETMGDGECRHTPTYRVDRSRCVDFALSMGVWLLEHPDENIFPHHLGLEPVEVELIDFLKKVEWKEMKRQWFSPRDRKISGNCDKQYDKRWFEVPTWASGQWKDALNLYWYSSGGGYPHLLRHYAVYRAFVDRANGAFYGSKEATKWLDEVGKRDDFEAAWRVMEAAFRSAEQRKFASRMHGHIMDAFKRREEEKAA